MEQKNRMPRCITLVISSMLLALITGCDYDAPITTEPTRKIQQELLGAWTGTDWSENDCKDQLRVAKYDEVTYAVWYNGDLYRAWHSDVGGTAFLSVQSLESEGRKYSYYAWSLSPDGQRLTLRPVKLEKAMTHDSATVVKVLQSRLQDADLFGEAGVFAKRNRG